MNEKRLNRKQRRAERNGTKPPVNPMNIANIRPLTDRQGMFFDAFEDGKNVYAFGSAGTGKSFIALYLGLRAVENRDFNKVIVFRSTVPSRDMGFLPGSESEKARVYEEPYKDICSELYGRSDAYEVLKQKGLIEFSTTAYVRGITRDNAVIIIDECQNMTFEELSSLITRVGNNSRVIFCGDTKQTDYMPHRQKSGFVKFQKILEQMDRFEGIRFTGEDIVRSELVKDFILTAERLELEDVI